MLYIKRLRLFKGLLPPLLLMFSLILVGTVGYMIIEGFTFLDAVYMTVITIASVGFSEVKPLSEEGRIFTIALILVNLALFTYSITLLSRYFSDADVIKKFKLFNMENSIQQLRQHVIICGFGRNGRESAQVLDDNNIPFVVVEEKDEPDGNLDFKVTYTVKGDATKDEVLLEAGIMQARALITTLPVDADNLFVVLTAKQLNPDIKIISRASQDSSIKKLKIAGASNTIMPDKIGGAHMATLVMLPDVAEMLSIMGTKSSAEFRVAELTVTKVISLKELNLWQQTNCTILGVKNAQGSYTINPSSSYNLNPTEGVIVMGSDAQIAAAEKLI